MIVGNFTRLERGRATPWRVGTWLSCFVILGLCYGCSDSHGWDKPPLADTPDENVDDGAAPDDPSEPPAFPDTGINATSLTVTGINPSSGPFSGD